MTKEKPTKTLAEVFKEFLANQKERISYKTYLKYRSIIGLYQSYLESYWPGHPGEYGRISREGGTFCSTFGPEEATAGYSEFLGYFMPRKVMCGKELMQAAGTVTRKLAKWLVEKGYTEDTSDAQEDAGHAARDLPRASKLVALLDAYLDGQPPGSHREEISDHFVIDRVEPGKLWLTPLAAVDTAVIGPVPVPEEVTKLCKPTWDIGGVLGKTARGWRLIEVWNVSP